MQHDYVTYWTCDSQWAWATFKVTSSATVNDVIVSIKIHSIYNVRSQSHTRTVVQESCKGDDASQWRNPTFDPPPRSNPISDSHKSWQRWLRRGPSHLYKSSSRSAQGFRFRACVTLRTKSVYSADFFPVFWVLATRYSQGPWAAFDAKYAETRGSAQGCAFSGSRR